MQNTTQPSPSQEPNNVKVRALEARLGALERRMAEQPEGFEAGRAEERPLERAELAAELEHHRDELRDYEKALVERIADVDDDRRTTASRLQRAWQTHSEELDERLRRHAGLLMGLLMLFVVLFATVLFVVYRQAASGQSELAAEVSEMREQLSRVSGAGADSKQVREKLDRLTAEFREIASTLERLDQDSEQTLQATLDSERAAREQIEGRFTAEIRRLGAEQERLAGDLSSLRSAVDKLQAVGAGKGADAAASMSGDAAGVLAPAPGPEPEAASEKLPEEVSEGLAGTVVETPVKGGEKDLPAAEAEAEELVAAARSDAPAHEESVTLAPGTEKTLVVDGNTYALQLIGFFNRKSVDGFVTRAGLPAQVYSMRQTYEGSPWYVIIHSLHEDYAAAEEELSRLPEDLLALKPWIRALGGGVKLRIIETGKVSE